MTNAASNSPSKTQKSSAYRFPINTLPLLLEKSVELIGILKDYGIDELCTLMKMSEPLGRLTAERIASFQVPFTRENSSQAIFTFQGDAYDAITPLEYSEQQLLHSQEHLAILSGLYGILRPLDLMQPYRLEMGAGLKTEYGKNLYRFWGKSITDVINRQCRESGFSTVVNLASAEYFKVLQKRDLEPRPLTISFKEEKEERCRAIPIYSKRARGMMIHFMIEHQLTEPEQLKDFSAAGYTIREDLSTPDEWVFTRKTD